MRHERKNPNSSNFGLRNRCMIRAGKNALNESQKGFGSKKTLHDRWKMFACWINQAHGIKDMRKITNAHLVLYGEHLKYRLMKREIKPATAQNYLSAVNSILEIARGDNKIHADPVGTCHLPKRSGICKTDKSSSLAEHNEAKKILPENIAMLLEIQRALGLRFEESAKLNPTLALKQAIKNSTVSITDGTKGGRHRNVAITRPEQVASLEMASYIQGTRSMIPDDQTYKTFRQNAYKKMNELTINFHGERHDYAQQRYYQWVGAHCPIKASIPRGKQHIQYLTEELNIDFDTATALDKDARKKISAELGHERIEITNSYLG